MTPTHEKADRESSRRFAWLLLQTEFSAILSNPFTRPSGWLLTVGSLIMTTAFLSLFLVFAGWIAALAAALVTGLLLTTAVYALTTWTIERRRFSRAPYTWLKRYSSGQARAYAMPDRNGRLTLRSAWASQATGESGASS